MGGVAVINLGALTETETKEREECSASSSSRATKEWGDMIEIEGGIIDSMKVMRTALQNAASIAGLMIATERLVADKPEEERGCPAAWVAATCTEPVPARGQKSFWPQTRAQPAHPRHPCGGLSAPEGLGGSALRGGDTPTSRRRAWLHSRHP